METEKPEKLNVSSISLSQTGELGIRFTKPIRPLPFSAATSAEKTSNDTKRHLQRDVTKAIRVSIDSDDDDSGLDPSSANTFYATKRLIGRRFEDAEVGIEVLATKGGEGSLALNGSRLELKDAKPLPSSD